MNLIYPDVILNEMDLISFVDVLTLRRFTSDKVLNKRLMLDVSKGCGLDSVPRLILKKCATSVASPLEMIYQR